MSATALLFSLSLLPYGVFLWALGRSGRAPRLALAGFWLQLLFVAVTLGAAIFARQRYGLGLAQHDALHGFAESFLCLSNALVAVGFSRALRARRRAAGGVA